MVHGPFRVLQLGRDRFTRDLHRGRAVKVSVLPQHVVVGKALIQHGVALAFGHRLPLLLFNVSKADVFHIFLLILRRHESYRFSTGARTSCANSLATSSRSSGLNAGLKSSASKTCRISISDSSPVMGLAQSLNHAIAACTDAHF